MSGATRKNWSIESGKGGVFENYLDLNLYTEEQVREIFYNIVKRNLNLNWRLVEIYEPTMRELESSFFQRAKTIDLRG